jgi:DNA-binding PadR family transcriptional regulator
MEMGPTGHVVLGMLAMEPQSGYDIKQLADISTRHFWAISYGQIYPELRRLLAAGLIKAQDASRGTRQRTIYRLTPEGRQALHAWVADPAIENVELRDEMLLKLFFADAMSRQETIRHLEAMRRRHEQLAAGLRDHEPLAAAQPNRMKYEVLKFGIGLHGWCADWCGRLAMELEKGREAEK